MGVEPRRLSECAGVLAPLFRACDDRGVAEAPRGVPSCWWLGDRRFGWVGRLVTSGAGRGLFLPGRGDVFVRERAGVELFEPGRDEAELDVGKRREPLFRRVDGDVPAFIVG